MVSQSDIDNLSNNLNTLQSGAKQINVKLSDEIITNINSYKTTAQVNLTNEIDYRTRANNNKECTQWKTTWSLRWGRQKNCSRYEPNKDYTKKANAYQSEANKYYNSGNNLYNDLYKTVYSQIQSISNEAVKSVNTTAQNADSGMKIDYQSAKIATNPVTINSANTNLGQLNETQNMQKTVNTLNSNVSSQTNNISSALSNANSATSTAKSAKDTTDANLKKTNEIAEEAKIQERIKKEIDELATRNESTKKFIDNYVNTIVPNANKNLNAFISSMENQENNSNSVLTSNLQKTPIPEPINGNLSASQIVNMQQTIIDAERNGTDTYQFVNFTPDSAKSYPFQCVGNYENSSKPPINMTPIDSNLHTYSSCKINSTLSKILF